MRNCVLRCAVISKHLQFLLLAEYLAISHSEVVSLGRLHHTSLDTARAIFPHGHINIFAFLRVCNQREMNFFTCGKVLLITTSKSGDKRHRFVQGDPTQTNHCCCAKSRRKLLMPDNLSRQFKEEQLSYSLRCSASGPVRFNCKTSIYIVKLLNFTI